MSATFPLSIVRECRIAERCQFGNEQKLASAYFLTVKFLRRPVQISLKYGITSIWFRKEKN